MVDVAQSYSDLEKAFQAGDYDLGATLCERILSENPQEEEALKSKVICLIHDGKVEQALGDIEKTKGKVSLLIEHAYCLYRLNRGEEALAVLKNANTDGVEQLRAQILYKTGDYDKAAKQFAKILESEPSNVEFKTNALAAYSLSSTPKKGIDLLSAKDSSATYEIIYNRACILIEMGSWDEADALLEEAKEKCLSTCKAEGMSEEEIADEVACVIVQQAFVHQMQGKDEQAYNEYIEAAKQKTSDMAALAVANNNIVTMKKDKDKFDSMKRIKSAVDAKTEAKLTKKQRAAVHLNRCLLSLHMGKGDQCREQANDIQQQSDVPALIMASMFWKEKNIAKCEETLKAYAAAHPDDSMRAVLSMAQMQFQSGRVKEAVKSLSSIEQIRHKPAVVATLLKMCEGAGEIEMAVKVYDDAVQWWSSNVDAKDEKMKDIQKMILREAAAFKSKNGFHGEALKEYKSLVQMDRYDHKALTGLIIAAAITEPNLAEQYEAKLPEVEGLDIPNGEELENASLNIQRKVSKRQERTGGDDMEVEKKKTTKKRKRKTVLPKHLDPANLPPLDPERWLPIRQRSYYKAKKGKKGNALRGSQGASASQAAAAGMDKQQKKSQAEEDAIRLAAEKQEKAASSKSQPRNKKKGRR